MMVAILDPKGRAFAFRCKLIEVERLQVLAVSLIDVDASDLVKQSELELQHDAVLNRDQISFSNFVCLLRNVTEMG